MFVFGVSVAFKDIGLKLVGPYDVLSGYLKLDGSKRKQSLCLLHWRYYYDPPEFQVNFILREMKYISGNLCQFLGLLK